MIVGVEEDLINRIFNFFVEVADPFLQLVFKNVTLVSSKVDASHAIFWNTKELMRSSVIMDKRNGIQRWQIPYDNAAFFSDPIYSVVRI